MLTLHPPRAARLSCPAPEHRTLRNPDRSQRSSPLLARPSFVAAQATCSSTPAGDSHAARSESGTISATGETDCYTFTGQAGEVVQLLSKNVGASVHRGLRPAP